MLGLNEKCTCPICGREYATNPRACACGFEGIAFFPAPETERMRAQNEERRKEQVFRIFKFAKQVYYGETVYEGSALSLVDQGTHVTVDEAMETRGLAVVDPDGDLPFVAAPGLVALRGGVRALILNTHTAALETLEESQVETLLLGRRFCGFHDGGLMQYHPLRYLFADGKNEFFTVEDNVLFNKDKTVLHLYAGARPGEEYRVPEGVTALAPYSFYAPLHLKRLYLPRGIRISEDAFGHRNAYWDRDGVLTKVAPAFEIVYY